MSQINKELRKRKFKEKTEDIWYGFWEGVNRGIEKLVGPVSLKIKDRNRRYWSNINNYNLDKLAKKSYSDFCRRIIIEGVDEKLYFIRNCKYMNSNYNYNIVYMPVLLIAINTRQSKKFLRYFWQGKHLEKIEERFIDIITKDDELNVRTVNMKDMGMTIFSESYPYVKDKIILEITVNKNGEE